MSETTQIKPLHHAVAPIWDYESSDYPDRIKVPMKDGQVVEYVRKVEQPHPAFRQVLDLIDKLPVYGPSAAGYKGRHEKK